MSWRDHLRPGIAELTALRLHDYGASTDLARLDCNELPFPPSPTLLRAFHRHLDRLALHRYPDVTGAPLRRALAERWRVDPDEILLGNGSIEVLATTTTAFGGAGAPVALFPDPSFPHYEVIARANGLRPVAVPLDAHFALDERAFADAIARHRPAVAIVASPNNPTGNAFDPEAIARLARRMDAAFIVDEAYVDFADGGADARSMMRRIRETRGLFVTRTFSKIGFAGLRVGALVGARDAIAELDKVRLPWNVNAASLAFATALLEHPDAVEAHVRAVVALRRAFEAELRNVAGVTVFRSEANFVLVRAPIDAAIVHARLLERGVLVKNVSRVGLLDRCLRISVGTAAENERCLRALREAF